MGEKNLWSKVGLIVLIAGMSLWQTYPFTSEQLKPGIDLGGGHNLLFEIDDSTDKRPDLAERVMGVLKNRIDPQGNRNLVWRPVGRNRLEIQIPRAPESQRLNRQNYEEKRTQLAATYITEAETRQALSLPATERDAAIGRMVGMVKARRTMFDDLVQADQRYRELTQRFEKEGAATRPAATLPAAVESSPPLPELKWDDTNLPLPQRVDNAFKKRNELIAQLLTTNLDVRVLEDFLALGKKNRTRIEGIEQLKSSHPDLRKPIEEMVQAYDVSARYKGALDDPADLMRLLRGAGVLEFRILATRSASNPSILDAKAPELQLEVEPFITNLKRFGPRVQTGDKYMWIKISKYDPKDWPSGHYIIEEYAGNKYVLSHATPEMGLLRNTGWTLAGAFQGHDRLGRLAIDFRLAGNGPQKFGELTGNNINRPLCIVLDDEAISSANINDTIYDSGQITGRFTPEHVDYIVRTLEAGSLPAKLKDVPLQQNSVGPSLGETNRRMGFQASVVAFVCVAVFMVVYYMFNGAIADVALLLNMVITLGIMSFLQATFTLPGIAGLVLTLGMAVDANVLIYERMREELQRGISVRMAAKLGYEKAFSAILDSNVTTIITAAILAVIGSEEIRGFGLTLGIGLATSMFTALFVTRQYFHIMVPNTLNSQETRRAWLGGVIVALAGGLLMGCGYLFHRSDLGDSSFWGGGVFLGWLGGTALALLASMWLFRWLYGVSGCRARNTLPMFKLMSAPNIDWMSKYKIFWIGSAVFICVGLLGMFQIHPSDFMDIEFIGGTSVQLEVKADKQKEMNDEKILSFVSDGAGDKAPATAVGWLKHAADIIEGVTVTEAGEHRFRVTTGEKLSDSQLEALLTPTLEDELVRNGITQAEDGNGVIVEVRVPMKTREDEEARPPLDLAAVQARVKQAAVYARGAAETLRSARAQTIEFTGAAEGQEAYEITTTEPAKTLVAEALLASMGDILEVTPSVDAQLETSAEAPDGIYPIKREVKTPEGATRETVVLSDIIGDSSQAPLVQRNVRPGADMVDFHGGLVMVFNGLNPAQTPEQVEQRIRRLRLQPGFEEYGSREAKAIGLTAVGGGAPASAQTPCTRVAVMVKDPVLSYIDSADNSAWLGDVAAKEVNLAKEAFRTSQSLQRVTQFDAQVAKEAAIKAVIAVVLSLVAIAAYLWVRFGSLTFGLAGIIALYHDVAVAMAGLFLAHYIWDTPIGRALMLRDFRIDLNIIAAMLTIVGFSINDTIVIFDRIRENRGRLATVSARLINDSLNQTLSRTILTTLTVLITLFVMYVFGGEGIHGFAFAMLIGSLSGTYSTLAIATPLTHHPRILWVVTVVVGGLTLAGLAWMIPVKWVAVSVAVIILALSVAALVGLFINYARQDHTRQVSAA